MTRRIALTLVFLIGGCISPDIFTLVPSQSSQNGRLLNLSADAASDDAPIDPSRPTIVITHGFNPLAMIGQFTFAQTYAKAINARFGARFNVLGWDWNAATVSADVPEDIANAIDQGQRLGDALLERGVDPARTKLIGHSLGCVLVATTARTMFESSASQTPLAELTLLDPVAVTHPDVFPVAVGAVDRIENFWEPPPTGVGQPVNYASVYNEEVESGANEIIGQINPMLSNHVAIVDTYLSTISDPAAPSGFNRSKLIK